MNNRDSSATFSDSVAGPAAEGEWCRRYPARADSNAYTAEAHGLVWGLAEAVEAAISKAAEMFADEMLVNYPRSFGLKQ